MRKNGFLCVLAGTAIFVLLFIFTEQFSSGLSVGLTNCARVVIPSIFPFLIASSLVGCGELPERLKKAINPLTMHLFKLPAECLPAIVLGQLGGYLSGAKTAQTLYSSGTLSQSQTKRLLLFNINAGMGFSVNAVGNALLCSREAGKIILAATCVSSFILGFFTKFLPDDNTDAKKLPLKLIPLSAAAVESVSSSAAATLTACAFVAVFSGITNIINSNITNEAAKLAAVCMLEVTNGCISAAGKVSLPLLAAICAFGGICVHLQAFSIAKSIKISLPLFYLFRILHAVLAFAICSVILHFFPIEEQVFLSFSPNAALWSFSAPASVSLLFLSAILILDLDNKGEIC